MNEFISWMLNRLKNKKEKEEWVTESLHLEDIRPEDLPPNDGPFPKPPPNKRVIIIDM